jgi:hypothetical protein
VFGREFRPDALGELCGVSPDQLLDTLDEAMVERVVEEVPGGPGRLRFGHVLMRDTLYEELTPGRRVQLHRDAGQVLETVYANDIEAHLAELAHHFLAAASSGTGDTAAAYARRAGERAMTQLAYEEAVRLFEMALPLVFDETERCDLLLSTGEAQMRAGDTPSAHRSLREAAQLADRLGLPEQLARAALGYGGRVLWDVLRGDPHHIPQLERALAVLPEEDSPLRVRLLSRLAAGPLRAEEFPPERRLEVSEEALDMARHIGEPATLAYALSGYISAHHSPAFVQRQEAVAAELIRVGVDAGDPERTLEGHEARALSRIEFCRIREAKEDLAQLGGGLSLDAAPDVVARGLLRQAVHQRLDLLQASLEPPKRVELEPVGHRRVPVLCVLSDLPGGGQRALGLSQIALEQSEDRGVHLDEPVLGGLA